MRQAPPPFGSGSGSDGVGGPRFSRCEW